MFVGILTYTGRTYGNMQHLNVATRQTLLLSRLESTCMTSLLTAIDEHSFRRQCCVNSVLGESSGVYFYMWLTATR